MKKNSIILITIIAILAIAWGLQSFYEYYKAGQRLSFLICFKMVTTDKVINSMISLLPAIFLLFYRRKKLK